MKHENKPNPKKIGKSLKSKLNLLQKFEHTESETNIFISASLGNMHNALVIISKYVFVKLSS